MHPFVSTIEPGCPPISTFKILLLEDDPVDCELIEATLKNGGVEGQFIRASGRQDFLATLNQNDPQLILADYVLPKFDGLEALKLAQQICPQIPFILVSGVLGEEQAIEAMKQGATDYVLKPRLERLVPSVQRALRESQERRERQRIEMALKQTDDLLRTVIDQSPVSIITLGNDQRVMTWNSAAEDLYGWSASAVVDRPLPIIDTQTDDKAYIAQALQGSTISNYECQYRRKDGSLVDVSQSIAPLHDARDRIYGVVLVAVNITKRKQIEQQRLRLLEQESAARAAAESANRIKDEFLTMLSHELRTPLNAIVGWAKLMQHGNLQPPMLQKAIDTIERNAIAQTRLIEDLLDLSSSMQGQVKMYIQPANADALIRATVDTLRPAIEAKSIQIDCDLNAGTEPILADPNRLQQILWNVLSNAVKFTPVSGNVTVSSRVADGHLRIQVTDSGIGIAADVLPHIFGHFRQADSSLTRSQGGLGLGLAIAHHLVELHGGTIQAESPGVDQGTTLTVDLPIRTTQARRPEPTPADSSRSLRGLKALVVDDDDDSLELIIAILEPEGVEIKSAKEAKSALDVLGGFRPEIVISNVGLPVADGHDFLETARSRFKHLNDVPAIALTAYAGEENRQRALTAGYQAHITKPFDIQAVVKTVHQLTRQAK